MWITAFLLTLLWIPETQAGETVKVTPGPDLTADVTGSNPTTGATEKVEVDRNYCEDAVRKCQKAGGSWTRCYEEQITTCRPRRRFGSNFIRMPVNSSQEAEAGPNSQYRVRIPSSALQKSRGSVADEEVLLVATLIDSTYFKMSQRGRGRSQIATRREGTVMGGWVLVVRAGSQPVTNLQEHVKLTFKYDKQVNGSTECVFWQEQDNGTGLGHWSTEGCTTENTGSEFICSCNHLSFFAVLVNPVLSVDKRNAEILSYITYVGSALSVFFTFISLIIYICLQRRRPEKAVGIHMQLTLALFCLHLSFLVGSILVWLNKSEGWVCKGLGLALHWSLLAAFCWTALEGFHLYLLLVKVFNIYVRRYLLKLSLVGWGIPTLTAVVCGLLDVYGKYDMEVRNGKNPNATMPICWMSSHRVIVSFTTTVAFPCLVVLCNSCMLVVVMVKLWGQRGRGWGIKSNSGWRKLNKENWTRLWKDCATLLGLSCVLGLPWAWASTTYISIPGIYVFTILNSLQGVFIFLWSLALTCKSRSEGNLSDRDPSTQKMMMTSYNN